MRRIVVPCFIFILLLVLASPSLATGQDALTPLKVFPDFMVTTLAGKDVSLYSNYKDKGKIIILDLFATWCPPCRMEIPSFIDLQERYKDKLVIVGLSFDQKGPEIVSKFAGELKMNYDLCMGTSEIAEAVQLSGIPRTFILYPDFSIKKDVIGVHTKKEFEDTINLMMSEPPKGKQKTAPKKK